MHPRARVRVLILVFPVYLSARFLIAFWFLFQLMAALGSSSEDAGVAFWAHIGGFIAGVLLVKFFMRPEIKLWPSKEEDEDLQSWLEYKGLKKSKPEIVRASGPWRKEPDAVRILSGVFEGVTTGTPIGLLIRNVDQRNRTGTWCVHRSV